jgi:hypothetical protein
MRRRVTPALAAAAVGLCALGANPPDALGEKAKSCSDHCAEQASKAESCADMENWRCDLYIWGCLAGCNIGRL